MLSLYYDHHGQKNGLGAEKFKVARIFFRKKSAIVQLFVMIWRVDW